MNNYNFDNQIAEAEQLRAAWRKDPIYYYTPVSDDQQAAWDCTKQNQIFCGGNRAGKTRLLLTKMCALVVPHPQDNNYSYWPTDLDLRYQGFKIDLREGVEIWISKRSFTDHEDVTMKYLLTGFKGSRNIPPLLRGRVRRQTFSPNHPNVWRTVELTNGSLVTLKSEEAGKRSYEGASKLAVGFDEPCNPEVYQEGKMRVIDSRGYTFYGLTGAMAHDGDPSVWRNITFVKNNLLTLGDEGNTQYQGVFYLDVRDNPFINYDFQLGQLDGMSDEEKHVRLTGRISVATGVCFFDLDDLGFLRRSVIDPQYIGTLEENFKEQIIGTIADTQPTWSVYLVENEYSSFPLRIYHYPEPGRQYFIGADVGGGGDPTAVVVIDDLWRICALQHGHIDEVSLAIELSKLGRYYRDAWIAPEVNKEGRVTASWLLKGNNDLGLKKYPKLFRRAKSKYERRGYVYIPGTDIGWLTTQGQGGTRAQLLAGLRELMIRAKREAQEDFVLINCSQFLDECASFCRGSDGKYEALTSSHDDIVLATGIAIQCLKSYMRQKQSHQQERPMQPAYRITPEGQLSLNFDTIIQQRMEMMNK
jgi:hypothetical protein